MLPDLGSFCVRDHTGAPVFLIFAVSALFQPYFVVLLKTTGWLKLLFLFGG